MTGRRNLRLTHLNEDELGRILEVPEEHLEDRDDLEEHLDGSGREEKRARGSGEQLRWFREGSRVEVGHREEGGEEGGTCVRVRHVRKRCAEKEAKKEEDGRTGERRGGGGG